MIILGFDTSLDKMYVSLANDENVIDSRVVETTNEHYHSAFLISTIKDILKSNDLSPSDVDLVATNIGPGSFTGIRACTTVARVFAQANDIKAIGVSSLEILSRISDASKVLVALDARKETAYVSAFSEKSKAIEPQVMLIQDLKNIISADTYSVVTDDKLCEVLGGVSYQKSSKDLGKILIEIAKEKYEQNADSDWRKLLPLYIQPPAVSCKK